MKHGNISNQGGITLAFRVEDTLLKKASEKPTAEFARKFNRLYGYELDTSVVRVIHHLYVNTDYNLVLVVGLNNKDKTVIKEVLRKIPFCQEVYVNGSRISEIDTHLRIREWEYYIDDNDGRRAEITSLGAVSLREFLENCVKL